MPRKIKSLNGNVGDRPRGANGSHPHGQHIPARVVTAYLRETAHHFGISPAKMLSYKGKGGGQPGATPIHRQIAIYLLRHHTGMHLDLLASRFQRTRTTVIRTLSLVDRKVKSKTQRYVEAIELVETALLRSGVAKGCVHCEATCAPGPECQRCSVDRVLTNGHTETKFAGTGRKGRAERAYMPPGSTAKPLPEQSVTTGGFRSRSMPLRGARGAHGNRRKVPL